MGGMLVLEYAYFGPEYVRTVVPLATSSRHSAWGISWGEAQRQSIYCDPKYDDGYYSFDDPPATGLGAARMSALLTYRSRDSFESRFGRNTPDPSRHPVLNGSQRPSTPLSEHWAVHNDGHKSNRTRPPSTNTSPPATPTTDTTSLPVNGNIEPSPFTDPQFHGATALPPPTPPINLPTKKHTATYFSAQSYLRYQGQKFVARFDSNCYIAITRKLDTHDISRGRVPPSPPADPNAATNGNGTHTTATSPNAIASALALIKQPTLVIGIESDGLFTFAEQQEIAADIPGARLRTIVSPEGHDAFLLQFEQVNRHIVEFFKEVLPDIMDAPGVELDGVDITGAEEEGVGKIVKSSTFGEAEVGDITAW